MTSSVCVSETIFQEHREIHSDLRSPPFLNVGVEEADDPIQPLSHLVCSLPSVGGVDSKVRRSLSLGRALSASHRTSQMPVAFPLLWITEACTRH